MLVYRTIARKSICEFYYYAKLERHHHVTGNQEYIKFKVNVIVVRRIKEIQFDVEVCFVILTLEYVYVGVLAKRSISYDAINY